MLDSIFFNPATDIPMDLGKTLLCILVALFSGLIISIVYLLITPKERQSSNMALSLVVLPVLIAVIILLIGSNLARAFSMAGVFALIRFRSVPGDSKDITILFMTVAAGLSSGTGYLVLGGAVTLLLCMILIILSRLGFGTARKNEKLLRIIIPEDMNFQGAFDDIFEKYTGKCKLQRVKTTNLGTLFELTYQVSMKDEKAEKEFIDELRSRNGNLSIMLYAKENNELQL
jgi:hypothetical protein